MFRLTPRSVGSMFAQRSRWCERCAAKRESVFSCLRNAAKHAVEMLRLLVLLGLALMAEVRISMAEVLIVADEFPAMEFLAGKLKAEEKITAKIVSQTELPASLAPFDAVVVYIHGALAEKAEDSFIYYTKA